MEIVRLQFNPTKPKEIDMELKQINRGIGEVRRSSVKINEKIQTLAVAIVGHAEEHGDCTPALNLVKALPASFRRNLLIEWFSTYSPIGMSVKDNRVAFNKPESKRYNRFNLAGAKANNWFEHEAPGQPEQLPDTLLEFDQKVESLIKVWETKLKNEKIAQTSVDKIKERIANMKKLIGFNADASEELKQKVAANAEGIAPPANKAAA